MAYTRWFWCVVVMYWPWMLVRALGWLLRFVGGWLLVAGLVIAERITRRPRR